MRRLTERPEAVRAGSTAIVGTSRPEIVAAVGRLLDDPSAHAAMAPASNPFGDGRAAERCVAALASFFDLGPRLDEFG
jgi:UDP-N-acetylglucosamine 2-epimerase (non-hydrolysing)